MTSFSEEIQLLTVERVWIASPASEGHGTYGYLMGGELAWSG
jgi:hypothetical protein